MKDVVIFHLKRIWEGKDLWEEIKKGRKRSEWRDLSPYWIKRLCHEVSLPDGKKVSISLWINGTVPMDLTKYLKVHRAWFVEGYPKNSLPRLEADITGLVYHSSGSQLEIKFTNVQEVTEEILRRRQKLSLQNEKAAKLLDSQRRRLAYSLHTVPKETT
jgi:hypothetical protein